MCYSGPETHTSASKQISFPVSGETGPVQKGKGDASESWRQEGVPSDGLVQQSGDILLLVAMGCTKDHHTVLQGEETHTANSLVQAGLPSLWPSAVAHF